MDSQLRNYAKVILELGINLQPGKNLIINSETIHWEFVNLLSDEAYKMGAQLVRVETKHPYLQKSRLLHSEDKHLEYIPSYFETEMNSFIDENWSIIHLAGEEEPDLMNDVDPDRSSTIRKAYGMARRPMISAQMSGKCPWVIAALPTPKWAAKVFGCEPSEEAAKKLWELMVPILRLDQKDPVQAWRDHSTALKSRIKILDDAKIDYVQFKGPDTDLKIHLAKNAIWEGGSSKTYSGDDYLPNIPTEEIFAVPDYRRVEGRVKVTRPVQVLGNQVKGAWFEIKDGKAVDFGADEGKEWIEKYFSIDDGAKYLGEVALVDSDSPIFKCGKVFENILFDENASCHIAFGFGFASGVKGGEEMTPEQQKEAGINGSVVHTDFMIGSEDISVSAHRFDGTDMQIISNGKFVI